MTIQEIRETLETLGYTIIDPSMHESDDGNFLFYAYTNSSGRVYQFWISEKYAYASAQMLSEVSVYEEDDISHIFFE